MGACTSYWAHLPASILLPLSFLHDIENFSISIYCLAKNSFIKTTNFLLVNGFSALLCSIGFSVGFHRVDAAFAVVYPHRCDIVCEAVAIVILFAGVIVQFCANLAMKWFWWWLQLGRCAIDSVLYHAIVVIVEILYVIFPSSCDNS